MLCALCVASKADAVDWDGETYVGATSGPLHLPNGAGKTFYPDGRLRSDGHFVDGSMQGAGVHHLEDGAVYTGNFVNGLREGVGRFINSGGCAGTWRYGEMHGIGRDSWAYGLAYEGQWANDQREGFGVEWRKDGYVVACGLWRDSRLVQWRSVPHRILPADSKYLTGRMQLAGEDILLMPGGGFYSGAMNADSQPHGQGVSYDRYGGMLASGQWLNGKLHDQTQLRVNEGTWTGRVVDGHPYGHGICRLDGGSIRAGNAWQESGYSHLVGLEFDKDANLTHVGRWVGGRFMQHIVPLIEVPREHLPPRLLALSTATVLFPGGRSYTGATKGINQRHGEGVMRSADGKELQRGMWCDDHFVSELAAGSASAASAPAVPAYVAASVTANVAAPSIPSIDSLRPCQVSQLHLPPQQAERESHTAPVPPSISLRLLPADAPPTVPGALPGRTVHSARV